MRSEREEEKPKLNWKDYIAIILAMLTTTLLPILIIIIVLVLVFFVLKIWMF